MSKTIHENEIKRAKNLIFCAEFIRDCAKDDADLLRETLEAGSPSIKKINDFMESRLQKFQPLVGVQAVTAA